MQYPIAIEWGDEQTATGITIPDIPFAVTAGDTHEEAYEAALEVAHIRLEEMASSGDPIPMPGRIEDHRQNPEYAGMGWGLLEIDVSPYLGKSEKVNVTLPGNLIRRIDGYVSRHNVKSRSNFLADAAVDKLRRTEPDHHEA